MNMMQKGIHSVVISIAIIIFSNLFLFSISAKASGNEHVIVFLCINGDAQIHYTFSYHAADMVIDIMQQAWL